MIKYHVLVEWVDQISWNVSTEPKRHQGHHALRTFQIFNATRWNAEIESTRDVMPTQSGLETRNKIREIKLLLAWTFPEACCLSFPPPLIFMMSCLMSVCHKRTCAPTVSISVYVCVFLKESFQSSLFQNAGPGAASRGGTEPGSEAGEDWAGWQASAEQARPGRVHEEWVRWASETSWPYQTLVSGKSHMKVGNHNYFLSWREPWHKFEVSIIMVMAPHDGPGMTLLLLLHSPILWWSQDVMPGDLGRA